MRPSLSFALFLLSLLTLLTWGAACSSPAAPPPRAAPVAESAQAREIALQELLPADVVGVLHVDATELMASSTVTYAVSMLTTWVPEEAHADLERGLEFARRIDELVGGLRVRPNGGDEAVVILRGQFASEDLELLTDSGEVSSYEGHLVRSNHDMSATLLDARTLVLGRSDTLRTVLDRADGRQPLTPLAHPELLPALERAGHGRHTLTLGLLHSEELMGPRGEQEPHIVAYDGYCQLDVRVLCEGGVLVPDAAERTQLYADVQQQYAEMRAALQNLPAELRGPIDSLNLRVAEERIVARFEADDEATQRLLSNMVQMMFLGVQSFAGPAGGPAVP